MDEWKNKRKKTIAYEILATCSIIVFIMIGLCCELNSDTILEMISRKIDNNFILVILQIQVTMDTLTIAIIALISGSVADSNMGIFL